jgi:hypothetical protein
VNDDSHPRSSISKINILRLYFEQNMILSLTLKALSNQEKKTMHSAKWVCAFLISILFITATAFAEEKQIRYGFWGGMDAGAGFLKQSLDEGNKDGPSFFLGFKGGYTLNPHFLIGLELSGWLLEASDQFCYYGYCSDAFEGEALCKFFLFLDIIQVKPQACSQKQGAASGSLE